MFAGKSTVDHLNDEPLISPFHSFDLPDDLFQPGETRPVKKSKKVPKKNVQKADGVGQGQKRGIDELDVS
jgi:poly(A) polymerase